MEGTGELLLVQCRWAGSAGRGVVLPGAFRRSQQHQGSRSVLPAGHDRRLKSRLAVCRSGMTSPVLPLNYEPNIALNFLAAFRSVLGLLTRRFAATKSTVSGAPLSRRAFHFLKLVYVAESLAKSLPQPSNSVNFPFESRDTTFPPASLVKSVPAAKSHVHAGPVMAYCIDPLATMNNS